MPHTSLIRLGAGDMGISLKVSDGLLRARITRAFRRSTCVSRPIDIHLELQTGPIKTDPEIARLYTTKLCGEDDYFAALAPNLSRGLAWINPHAPLRALFGTIRRIHARWLLANKGAVFHAACVVRNKQAYLFFGKSGAGKTTVCRLSKPARTAADDLIAVKKTRGQLKVWGLPSFKPPYILARGPYPVRAAFVLNQARHTHLQQLTPAIATATMLGISHDEMLKKPAAAALAVLAAMTRDAPCYALHFQKNTLFWRAIEKELSQ